MSIVDATPVRADSLDREQDIRDATAEVTARFDRAYWLRCVEEKRQPLELMAALGDSGLLGIGVPEEHGGQGGGLFEQSVFTESLARAGIPAYSFLVANFTRNVMVRFASADQVARFVPRTLDGRHSTCFGLTEADAGTNMFAMRTKAEHGPDGWRINGEKVFISAAGEAHQMMLTARTGPVGAGDRTSGLSIFVFDLPTAGVSFSPQRIRTLAPERQYIVALEDVLVPDSAVVGEVGQGAGYLFHGLNPERILAGAMALGLGFFALHKAAAYATGRNPFGPAIGGYQGVAHPLARAYVHLEAARLAVYDAAVTADRDEPAGIKSNSAKFLASEAAGEALDAAIQAHGGYAFDQDYDVVSLYEPIRLLRIAPINNESVLSYVAQRALGLPRSG